MTARRKHARPPVDCRDCWEGVTPIPNAAAERATRDLLGRFSLHKSRAQTASPTQQEGAGAGELKAARELLARFTRGGRAQRRRRPINFDDIYAVSALELLGKTTSDPHISDSTGAWLQRLKDRGAGHCTPLCGAAEGLHVLVLDAQAVAELWDAMAGYRASVANYAQLQSDLTQLRGLRGDDAGMGEAG